VPAGQLRNTTTLRVWDVVVRLTHWSVAAIVCYDLIDDSGDQMHRVLGYVAAGLVLFRILWGFIGSEHARFRAWLPRPAGVLAHARAMARLAEPGAGITVLGPAEAPLALIRGRYRYRLLVKTDREVDLQAYLRAWLARCPKIRGNTRIAVDVDPQSFL